MIRNIQIYYISLSPRAKFAWVAAFLILVYFWNFSSSFPKEHEGKGNNGNNGINNNNGFENRDITLALPTKKPAGTAEEQEAEWVSKAREAAEKNYIPSTDHTTKRDIGIVVLGYSLHQDGMPTRVLKNRVDKASEVYAQQVALGFKPLVILSGRGKKASPEFIEAYVMREIAQCGGIPDEDLLVDADSTNTVENALRTAELLKGKNVNTVYIVTSDYHVLRSQYIFNSAYPSQFELNFVGASTPAAQLPNAIASESFLFKNSQAELESYNLIDLKSSFGYHPVRNPPRWKMIEHELEADIRNIPDLKTRAEENLYMIDYGSNYGYFSIQLAKKFPNGLQFSLEGEAWQEYKGASAFHKQKMEEMNITNNILCTTKTQPPAFVALKKTNQVYQYQLCLSIFHWFNMPTRESFEDALYHHLSNARTTFLELPEARHYTGKEGQHAWDWVNIWYDGRSEVEVINDISKKYQLKNVRVKVLGAVMHDNETIRKLIRVDLMDNQPKADVDSILKAYGCSKDKVYRNAPGWTH